MIGLGIAFGRRALLLSVLSVLFGASPAWAMRAHDYIDADQRAHVTLPSEYATPAISVEPQPRIAAIADQDLLPPREPAPQAAAAKPVVSPVPEPSGYAMLGLGLLLLLLMPSAPQQGEAIAPDPDKQSTL